VTDLGVFLALFRRLEHRQRLFDGWPVPGRLIDIRKEKNFWRQCPAAPYATASVPSDAELPRKFWALTASRAILGYFLIDLFGKRVRKPV
jgi:hypothetical protein